MLCKTSRCFNVIIITVTLVTMTIIIITIIIVQHTQLKLPLFLVLVNLSCGRNSTNDNVLHKRNVMSTHVSVTCVHISILDARTTILQIIRSISSLHKNIYLTFCNAANSSLPIRLTGDNDLMALFTTGFFGSNTTYPEQQEVTFLE